MSGVFLASPTTTVARTAAPRREPPPRLSLESLDGTRRIPLDESTGWKALAGATGLDMPPFDVVTEGVPGVPGSVLQEVLTEERPVFIPIKVTAPDRQFVTEQALLHSMMQLVDPLLGEFLVVASTARGERELKVVYTDGLRGDYGVDQFGMYWRKIGLTALACDPFAQSRVDRRVEFRATSVGTPFIGPVGGSNATWPGALVSSTVIGLGMGVEVASEVPVFPTLDLVGPMDSFEGSMSTGWSVSVPDGVPAGSTLRLVTDPRARSIRLGVGDPSTTPSWAGVLAAGAVARGSTLRPFHPGLNLLDVVAPGGADETRIRLTWREKFRPLW